MNADYLKQLLAHSDATVRALADWTLEYRKARNLRPQIPANADFATHHELLLAKRLEDLATNWLYGGNITGILL